MFDDLMLALLLIFLYAETHYRFRYFFSWLKKPEPEIIADIPSRIQKHSIFPILIIIKDADKYPIKLIDIFVTSNGRSVHSYHPNQYINDPYKEFIYECDISALSQGANAVNVKIVYERNGKIRLCNNDNHRGTSHAPLPLYISESPIPTIGTGVIGETHTHTNYTSDQVEFGASVSGTARLARAMGFDFYCATDHSYDLDDMPDNYLKNDPQLSKWKKFKSEVANFNAQNDSFIIIPGEEVTIRNHKGYNVHCLVYNSPDFYPGSGDGAERWFRWKSELSLAELISLAKKNASIFAAHPFEDPPLLQKLFIGRDKWTDIDCSNPNIDGLQLINGATRQLNDRAKQKWIELLLQGFRITGIAGNDAHGNFSRFRQVGFPFFTMRENYLHLFGKWFTGVYGVDLTTKENILSALSSGNCYLSNGPAIEFKVGDKKEDWKTMGENVLQPHSLRIHVLSGLEFGQLKEVKIFFGNYDTRKEQIIYQNSDLPTYELATQIDFTPENPSGYLRAEVHTDIEHQALSNPVWTGIKN